MRAVSRDRSKLLFISIALLAGLFIIGNLAFGNHRAKSGGMYTSAVKIVKVDDTEAINSCKKYSTPYAHRVKEDGKIYLKYFSWLSGQPSNGIFTMTSEQYEELTEGKLYWFNIDFDKTNDASTGKVKRVYKENPIRR